MEILKMDLSLSFSKYATFKKCMFQYIYNYITKPEIPPEPQSYALVLGTLTHLFIDLYHKQGYSLSNIMNIKDDKSILYDHITIQYLARDFNSNKYAIKSFEMFDKVDELIKFINENEVVFFHAIKLFKLYLNDILYKFERDSIYTEFTFNNIIKRDGYNICSYGSIDIIFFKIINDMLSYAYFGDFKTGKNIDDYALKQLWFYIYNILNYDTSTNSLIENNTDNIVIINQLKDVIIKEPNKCMGIIFKLRDATNKKKNFGIDSNEYNSFINELFFDLDNVIVNFHKEKNNIYFNELYLQYKDIYKYKEKSENSDIHFLCKYCKFSELCNYRITGDRII